MLPIHALMVQLMAAEGAFEKEREDAEVKARRINEEYLLSIRRMQEECDRLVNRERENTK
jgi:hypothetical protein